MEKRFKIGIVGLGLIGGSIFKAFLAEKFDLVAVSRSEETVLKAKAFSSNVSTSLDDLKGCNVVFVCTPMNKTLEILNGLENILSPETIVTDVCSLKSFLCDKKYTYKFIPSHPMAGTEFSGFDNSFETLFEHAKWVLTPLKGTLSNDVTTLSELIETLGAKAILANSKEHDEAVALVSHMPMLLSQALFKAAQHNKLALELASSGFRDMTRLALSNTEMAQDMVKLNSENIQSSILKLYASVGELLGSDYKSQIEEIKKCRQGMYFDGKNIL